MMTSINFVCCVDLIERERFPGRTEDHDEMQDRIYAEDLDEGI